MTWSNVVLECLKANKIQTLVHIPGTILTDLIRQANEDDYFDVLNPTREEEGVAIICGSYLGGRPRCAASSIGTCSPRSGQTDAR